MLSPQPGEVIFIPADSPLVLEKEAFAPLSQATTNTLLESIAEAMPELCAAVLLGSCGPDTLPGTRAIKAAGGLLILPPSDPHHSQTSTASDLLTSLSDLTLPPEQIPEHLDRLATTNRPEIKVTSQRREESQLARMRKLTSIVKRHTGLDISAYKPEAVSRRIERRMGICQIPSLAQYITHIHHAPTEAEQLARDMLISVTRFFRDPDVFARLRETVLPGLFKEAKSRQVRFWVPACATGEEAYTLAILLEETLRECRLPAHNYKIFATDLDRNALAFASRGLYPRSITQGIPPDLLDQYFLTVGQSCQIHHSVRERIVFAKHNILKDPPFTRLDLVSCRNLLIYLNPAAQHRVLAVLRFSLRPGGALILGQSETVGDMHEDFALIDPKTHIFFKHSTSTASIHDSIQFGISTPLTSFFEHIPHPTPACNPAPSVLLETFTNRILSHMDRTCFVLNDRHEILYSFGNPGKYTTLAEGRASIRLEDLLPPELSIPFNAALGLLQKGKPGRFGPILLDSQDSSSSVSLLVEKLHLAEDDRNHLLVFIEQDHKTPQKGKTAFDLQQSMLRIRDLEEELEFSKIRLNSSREELEASREELQTSNEELQAANEELQSTNEELESVNEELQTVNCEYQTKIRDLSKSNEELDSFIASADIATIFLDPDLRIRRFTPSTTSLTGLLPHDIGRPITNFSHPLLAEATAASRLILAGNPKIEKALPRDPKGTLILRATPFTRKNGHITGTTVTFIPVDL